MREGRWKRGGGVEYDVGKVYGNRDLCMHACVCKCGEKCVRI